MFKKTSLIGFTVCLIFVLLSVFAACSKLPDLKGAPVIDVKIVDTGYKKSTNWDRAQGLACDGRRFYYAGHNDNRGKAADIHIIDAETMADVRVLENAGAMHSAELYYSHSRSTLFACSGGDGRKPYVFEIDPTDGKRINEWYFDDLGEKGGGLITFDGDGNLILFTSSDDGARIGFDVVSLYDGGRFDVLSSCLFSDTDLGVPQGLEWYDGYLYLLCDPGKTVNHEPHYMYKIELVSGGTEMKVLAAFNIPADVETEGLCFAPNGNVYLGDARERIWKLELTVSELAAK